MALVLYVVAEDNGQNTGEEYKNSGPGHTHGPRDPVATLTGAQIPHRFLQSYIIC